MRSKNPVFLLEDDLVDALAVKRAFKETNISNELIHFQNGEEALFFIEKNKEIVPSIFLIDLNMPRMGGIEFLQQLSRNQILSNIPIIVLTTSNESQDHHASKQFKVHGYLVKPVNFNDYKTLIHSFSDLLTVS